MDSVKSMRKNYYKCSMTDSDDMNRESNTLVKNIVGFVCGIALGLGFIVCFKPEYLSWFLGLFG